MPFFVRRSLLSVVPIVLFTSALASAESLNDNLMVVFGDSLSDTGNDYIATGGAIPGPASSYANGEFTNGPATVPSTNSPVGIWVDQLAPALGMAAPKPVLAGGTDIAFGGAETGGNPSTSAIPSVNVQVNAVLGFTNNSVPSNALYTFWAGANDILDNPGSATAPVNAADSIYNNILQMHAAGGKDFLWFNLPPLGLTPEVTALGQAAVDEANGASGLFDSEMQIDVGKLMAAGINVIPVDIASLYDTVLTHYLDGCTVGPADPYCFSNITTPAQGLNVDPNSYLFWDDFHPTTEGQYLIAVTAYDAIQTAVEPAIPEPASVGLAAAGLIAFGLLQRRRRPSKR